MTKCSHWSLSADSMSIHQLSYCYHNIIEIGASHTFAERENLRDLQDSTEQHFSGFGEQFLPY